MDEKTEAQKLREKYRQKYVEIDKDGFRASGVFVEATRNRLLDMKDRLGRRQYRFWHKNRKRVKTALVDLQLFIETANRDSDVNNVINYESLAPIVNALLYQTYPVKRDSSKAKLAQLLIEIGFSYLRHVNIFVGEFQSSFIDDAIAMSRHLTMSTLPEDEKEKYFLGASRSNEI